MSFTLNPFTGKLDANGLTQAQLSALFLLLDCSNDPLTGELTITPAGDNALKANKNITIRAGSKLIFDGA